MDDEVELMEALCEMLRDKGYEVDGFASETKALAALHGADYDILLADLMMPELNGVELLKAGLQIDSHLVGIIMTGQGTVQTAVEAMKAGAFDYILKPFKLEAVLPVIVRAMDVRRLRRENVQLRATLAIYELNQTIAYTLDPDTLLNKVADAVLEQCQADEVSILLPAREGAELRVAVVRGEGREKLLGTRMASDRGVAGWVARHREPLTLHGEARDPRFAPVQPRADIHSAISMPMLAGNKLVGVLNVNATQRRRPFTLGEIKALGILVSTASAALEAASLYVQVRASEEKYRIVLENVDEVVYRVDVSGPDPMQGKVEFVSPRVENIIGFTPEEFVNDPGLWARLLHPEDAPAMIAQTRTIYDTGHGGTREYRLLHKTSGEYRWMEDRISLQRDAEGRPVTLVGVARDVTERKQAEEALRRSEALLRHVLDALPVGVWIADRHSTIVHGNPAGQAIWGGARYVDMERYGEYKGWWLPSGKRIEAEEWALARAIREGETSLNEEIEIECFDGAHKIILNSAVPIRDAAGAVTGAIMVNQDITERKR
ncbi:MAG: PAS domain S-box protein, partial [Chloroflexota bacterium]